MRFEQIRKPLLMSCLAASVALHVGAFCYFYTCPVTLAREETWSKEKHLPQALPLIPEELFVEKMEEALEQSLNQLAALPQPEEKRVAPPKAKLRDEEFCTLYMQRGSARIGPLFDPESSAGLSDFALQDDSDNSPFEYETEKYASIDLIEPLLQTGLPSTITEEELAEEDQEIFEQDICPTLIGKKFDYSFALQPDLKKLKTPADPASPEKPFAQINECTIPRLVLPNTADYLREEWLKRSLADRTVPGIEHYGIEQFTSAVDWDESVPADVHYILDSESKRYIFSVTLRPDFDKAVKALPQHYYFIIDRSHSVEKQKMARYNRAVSRALASLNDGDTFNIFIFDKRVEKFSERSASVNSKTLQRAQDFLDSHQGKSHCRGESFTSLDRLLPSELNEDEMHSVILVSDGNTLVGDMKQNKMLAEWFKSNRGNVNFYTATSGKDNNLALLDLLSYETAGKLLYSETNAGFPRKLVRLVKDLHRPLAKEVTIDVIAKDANAKIALAGSGKAPLPPMFADKPYTIIGTIDELCDFTLLIQGKSADRPLNIKQNVSLKDATSGGRSLIKAWASSQANICYERFLETGKSIHLKEAKTIVAPYEGTIALD